VAEAPATAYNPLFLYSGVGLGKTHLLQAIGNYVKQHKKELKAYYTPAENIFIELIDAIEKDRRVEFKNKYRSKDLLLIDDIHYLIGKERLQEEIFYTFNYLYDNGGQIVISSDRPPKELPTLEERLISRFEGGLVVDIQPPDLETRMAILRKKGEMEGRSIPQDVAYLIASQVRSNIRELEGCLIRLLAVSSISGQELSVGLAQKVLKDLLGNSDQLTKELIVKRVAKEFGVSTLDLRGPRRKKELVLARHVAMYLLKSLLDLPLTEVGHYFGSRDHTTVLHACKKVAKLSESDPGFGERLKQLTMAIKGV
jgi:chromosomal replication initiator protein